MRLCNSQRIYDLAAKSGMSFDRSSRSRRWKLSHGVPSFRETGRRVENTARVQAICRPRIMQVRWKLGSGI